MEAPVHCHQELKTLLRLPRRQALYPAMWEGPETRKGPGQVPVVPVSPTGTNERVMVAHF